ncbi:MAG: glycosyltransferase family 4 protein [Candidatus Eremiobacteraeota bacterium]|nr:glycosyltransferase family 4 protein [Candidatus Eremiobacteraeota bacterium]
MARYPHLPRRAVVLSFEGPDRYAMVGGLGVRASELSVALADAGFDTDLIYVGDPSLPAVESRAERFTVRRWCQWISAYHPQGVYDGEWGKINDYGSSVPPFLLANVVEPAAARGERVLVLAEDWQVVPAVLGLDALLRRAGVREAATIVWNANNTYGFDTIDFDALASAAHITGVSRYMKFELALTGAEALVIPNGIPERIFDEVKASDVAYLRRVLAGRHMLLKVGRFDPDKRWLQAIDAVADLRDAGTNVQLVVRGGKEPYASVVFGRAVERGLRIEDVTFEKPTVEAIADTLAGSQADIVNVRSFLPDAMLYTLYGAVDAVLANSGKEPFGLVGLEVMAAGGIAVCGSTGEDYARAFDNAIVCDTSDPLELATYLDRLFDNAAIQSRIRENAPITARQFSWPNVLDVLDAKVAFMSERA